MYTSDIDCWFASLRIAVISNWISKVRATFDLFTFDFADMDTECVAEIN